MKKKRYDFIVHVIEDKKEIHSMWLTAEYKIEALFKVWDVMHKDKHDYDFEKHRYEIYIDDTETREVKL